MEVRPARSREAKSISAIYLLVLEFLQSQDYHIPATVEAAEWMSENIFKPSIDSQSGIYIATSDGKWIGVLFMSIDPQPFKARYKTATNYGQWVHPDYRGMGIVPKMFEFAKQEMKRLNVKRIVDMVHTPESRDAARAAGFEISDNFVTLEL